jgi:hypothetical protein
MALHNALPLALAAATVAAQLPLTALLVLLGVMLMSTTTSDLHASLIFYLYICRVVNPEVIVLLSSLSKASLLIQFLQTKNVLCYKRAHKGISYTRFIFLFVSCIH